MFVKTKETIKQRKVRSNESISAFKEELRALSFEPIYGESVKDIIMRFTTKIQELAEQYGYEIEFPKKAGVETDGNIYYFVYNIKVKTKMSVKKLKISIQYIMYDNNQWVGLITGIK
ncbi:hypothetical protein GFB69_07975 [Acidianus ambivalens]|uniref:Uncharacterized protein n=1 Tax=Acidianus ambivalens TaxID=2283 RepID=A0A650CVM5_ACIAM|nr:hypothetical protein [Acidianus ambivalens]QGR21745.1 hypothetical protein D1866_06845 [Acidianus ambivalens]